MIRRNPYKSSKQLKNRTLYKITAATVLQFINIGIFNKNINNIKIHSEFQSVSC